MQEFKIDNTPEVLNNGCGCLKTSVILVGIGVALLIVVIAV